MLAPELFLLRRPLSAMCSDRVDLQDCLEHGRTAKVLALYLVKCHKRVRSFVCPLCNCGSFGSLYSLHYIHFGEGFCKCILKSDCGKINWESSL